MLTGLLSALPPELICCCRCFLFPTSDSNCAQEDRSEQRDVQVWIERQPAPQTRWVCVQHLGPGDKRFPRDLLQMKGHDLFFRKPRESIASATSINLNYWRFLNWTNPDPEWKESLGWVFLLSPAPVLSTDWPCLCLAAPQVVETSRSNMRSWSSRFSQRSALWTTSDMSLAEDREGSLHSMHHHSTQPVRACSLQSLKRVSPKIIYLFLHYFFCKKAFHP